jgi:hypothetical protein
MTFKDNGKEEHCICYIAERKSFNVKINTKRKYPYVDGNLRA